MIGRRTATLPTPGSLRSGWRVRMWRGGGGRSTAIPRGPVSEPRGAAATGWDRCGTSWAGNRAGGCGAPETRPSTLVPLGDGEVERPWHSAGDRRRGHGRTPNRDYGPGPRRIVSPGHPSADAPHGSARTPTITQLFGITGRLRHQSSNQRSQVPYRDAQTKRQGHHRTSAEQRRSPPWKGPSNTRLDRPPWSMGGAHHTVHTLGPGFAPPTRPPNRTVRSTKSSKPRRPINVPAAKVQPPRRSIFGVSTPGQHNRSQPHFPRLSTPNPVLGFDPWRHGVRLGAEEVDIARPVSCRHREVGHRFERHEIGGHLV